MNKTQTLINLQAVDSQLLEIRELLGDLPLKVEELTAEEIKLKQDIDDRKIRIREIELQVAGRELEVKDYKAKIEHLKEQLYLVKTNKQYDALTHEIDFLKEKLNELEKKESVLLNEKGNLHNETQTRENNLESLTVDLHKRRTNLELLMNESAEQKNELEIRRSDIVKDIEPSIIYKYNKVLEAREGMAVVEVFGSSCGGCGSMVPPQKIAELKQGNLLQTCDVCSRFLYWPKTND